jgi:serine-type D-Ala-D-Ala carboxypeptidase (penicillin-binding protein 5/6)
MLNITKYINYFFIAVIVFLSILLLVAAKDSKIKEMEEDVSENPNVSEWKNPFDGIEISADAAIVYDLKKGEVIYDFNSYAQQPLASLAKLMTGIVTAELLRSDDEVIIGEKAIREEGDTGLFVNERWQVDQLLAFTLLTSSNDGAQALRDKLKETQELDLVSVMNNKAQSIGMNNTYFLNPSGLDLTESLSGAYGTANDMAILMSYILRNHYELFRDTRLVENSYASLHDKIHSASNTNPYIETIPSPLLSKTGYTNLAGGNLAVVFEKEPAHPIAVVVLGSESQDTRFTDMEKLIWAAINF